LYYYFIFISLFLQIRKLDIIQAHPEGFVIIFRWPVHLSDESAVVTLLESNAPLRLAVSTFSINYNLFLAFNVHAIPTSNSSNTSVTLYHAYALNNTQIYSKFKREREAAVLNCGICSTPLHEMDAHGQLLSIEVNMVCGNQNR